MQALGLSSPGVIGSPAAVIPPPGLAIPTIVPPGLVGAPGVLPQPVLAANAPGIITGDGSLVAPIGSYPVHL